MCLNNRELLFWKVRGRGEIESGGGQAGQQAGIIKVRLGLGGRERREIETEIERNRNKET
jgi:hypothetical protein